MGWPKGGRKEATNKKKKANRYVYACSKKGTRNRSREASLSVPVVVILMEPSVSSLMDHLNGVETRRRVVMMKRKEAETRLTFATEEQQQLEQQRILNEKLEVELKEELDHFLEEQRQVQLRLISGMDAIRKSEVEEALLIEHVRTQVQKVESLLETWKSHSKELDDLRTAWDKDDAAYPLKQRITHLEEKVSELSGEKERLEQLVNETMKAHLLRTTGIAAAAGESTQLPIPAGYHVAAIQLKEQLGLEHRELAKLQAHHMRQLGALDREVTDVTGRSVELSQWLADTVAARDQVLVSIQQLQSSLNSGVCVSCRIPS